MAKNSSRKKATRNIEPAAESPEDNRPSTLLATTAMVDESAFANIPEGFADIYAERVVGWFATVPGNAMQGVLVDTFETTSKFRKADGSNKKKVYKIEITNANPTGNGDSTIYIPASDDDEPETSTGKAAVVGDLVGLDERGWLKSLSKVVVGQEVWIGCLGKEPPSANYPQGAWKFIVRAKPCEIDQVTGEVKSKR